MKVNQDKDKTFIKSFLYLLEAQVALDTEFPPYVFYLF